MGRTPPQSRAQGPETFEDAILHGLVGETLASIGRLLGEEVPRSEDRPHKLQLSLLRALLRMRRGVVRPVPDARAPLGHACPGVERALKLGPGEGLSTLEDLADLGLLSRELVNRVHVCPDCNRCAINFRECCVDCGSLHIELEPVLHHYRCAYTGLQSEFEQDLSLVCPKCRRELFQIGRDFERPHETFTCRDCRSLFEEPRLEGQCLSCARVHEGSEIPTRDIHGYRPTALAAEAVDQGRLTDLSVGELLFDQKLRLDTRGFLLLEARRETERLRRHGVPFSVGILTFEVDGRAEPEPIFQDWDAGELVQLGKRLSTARSPLDVIARLDERRIGVLLPQTDADGAAAVRDRLLERLEGLELHELPGPALEARWETATFDTRGTEFETVHAYLTALEVPAQGERPAGPAPLGHGGTAARAGPDDLDRRLDQELALDDEDADQGIDALGLARGADLDGPGDLDDELGPDPAAWFDEPEQPGEEPGEPGRDGGAP